MKDQKFNIYSEPNLSLSGEICEGCLHLTSEVWGSYDSEQHIDFTKDANFELSKSILPSLLSLAWTYLANSYAFLFSAVSRVIEESNL